MDAVVKHRTSNRGRALAVCFIAGIACAAGDDSQLLIWRDGSSLRGRITSATASEMTVVSPIFAEPVMLDRSVIGEVQFERSSKSRGEPFMFWLADGTTLTGSLARIANERMIVRNSTLGDFEIPMSEVLSMQRASEEELSQPIAVPASGKPAETQPAAVPNAKEAERLGVNHATNLPERCDILLKLRTQPRPTFRVIVTGASGKKVMLEAKNGDLVLQGRLFYLIKNLVAADGAMSLHLYWNQRTGQCALCTSAGVCIGDTSKGPVGEIAHGGVQGVRIEDSAPASAIAFLGVNSWDGVLPHANETDGPGVLLSDDTAVKGGVVASDGTSVQVRNPDGSVKPVRLDKVFRIRFSPVRATPPSLKPVSLWFADGTRIDGRLTGILKGVATFETRLMSAPMSFKLDALRQMAFRANTEAEKAMTTAADSLKVGDTVMLGMLGEGEATVHWKPTGAKSAVTIAKDVEHAITRSVNDATTMDGTVFHLSGGEVLSGQLTGMNRKEVEGTWDFGGPFKLPAEQVRAIQFPADRVNLKDFTDAAWVPDAGESSAVSLNEKEVRLAGKSSVTHPSAMRAGEIRFQWQPVGSYCELQMRLFCDESGGASSGMSVRLYCNQGRVRVLLSDGNDLNRTREVGATVVDATKPVAVRMQIEEDHVGLWVNDSSRYVLLAGSELRKGNGLMFEARQVTSRLFIAGALNGRVIITPSHAGPIRIWNFAATTGASHLRPAGGVPAAARAEALRIPRFRQDSPPRHLIVAANRDLLRGDIEAVAAGQVQFRSGLEMLRIPLDRLAAIVTPLTVKKEKEDSTPQPSAVGGRLYSISLNSGCRIVIELERINDHTIHGKHPVIGACRIPLARVTGIDTRAAPDSKVASSLDAWRWELAPEPVLPETGGESSLALGKDAAVFKLPLLGDGDFDLAREKGKVVVLDFWATWCGPCVKSLPGLIKAMSEFPPDRVKMIGVNQGEGGEVVKRFLETRRLKLTVAMDAAQDVARQYGVEGIPHTVIIGPDGKIAWVKTGFSAEGAKEAAAAVARLLKDP